MTEQQFTDALVERDARNRALRTFLQGLGIDVLVAIAVTAMALFAGAGDWSGLGGLAVIGFSFSKSIVQAVASYIMRRFLDASKVPTPAPPAESGELS